MLAEYTQHMGHKAKWEKERLKDGLTRMDVGWERCAAAHATSVLTERFPYVPFT